MGPEARHDPRRDGGAVGGGELDEGLLGGVASGLGLRFLLGLRLGPGLLLGLAAVLVGLALTLVPLAHGQWPVVVVGLQHRGGDGARVQLDAGGLQAGQHLGNGGALQLDQVAPQLEGRPGLLDDALDPACLRLEALALRLELLLLVLRGLEAPRGLGQRGALDRGGRLLGRGLSGLLGGRGGGLLGGRGLGAAHLGEGGVEALVDGPGASASLGGGGCGWFCSGGGRGGRGSGGGRGVRHQAACAGAAGAPSGGEGGAPAGAGAGSTSAAARSAISRTSSSQSRSSSRRSSGTSQRVHCW